MIKKRIINGKETTTEGFESLYPFESHFINIDGHEMHYLDEGEGKPVLMLHGNPTWSFYFRHLVNGLSGEFRTIVPDHIGCGFSDKPSIRNYDYTLKNRVNDIEVLINSLNLEPDEKISLVLHDWGGMIGLAWALRNMDRVDKVVITNTAGFFLPSNTELPIRLWLIKYLKAFAIPAVLGFNIFSRAALYMAPYRSLSKAVKTGLLAPYNSWKNRIATLRFVQDIPITPNDRSYSLVKHVEDNLHLFKEKSMLILWGQHDFVFDLSFLAEWRKRFPRVPVRLFETAGHYLFEDKPRETTSVIRGFLRD
ncbi:Haloalkane dehalogenase [Desulfamplus magnetovallimortis]|uniref:Haloalkane dehalogenase n=1 Tax=Desulfamplus magnetovallimortis TaxID=1246637 RepID=A0A1W1HCA3_9BACT|nr:alpha/beta fold hydrolase [Desulfamplus magnetovallimortis]SLM30066.1 Haloalkane dehalogenase [Desulfamplus magnetovallimortis]